LEGARRNGGELLEAGPMTDKVACRHSRFPLKSGTAVAVDWTMLERLRAGGALKVSFHPDGALSAVEFSPLVAAPAADDDAQHEDSTPQKRKMSATGGLVPRLGSERS
jgi:hypothetical protein